MKKLLCLLASTCCLAPFVVAQQSAAQDGPPPVLVVQYEIVKPGHTGMMHEKTESAFVKAMRAAHSKEHYLGTTSLSGDNAAIFFEGYGSFADWEKSMHTMDSNPTLSREMDAAYVADGEMLSNAGQAVLVYEPKGSYNADKLNVGATRYWEVEQYDVKPGHDGEWNDLVKMYGDALKKVSPDSIWALYHGMYGHNNGGHYTFFIPLKSLAEVDAHMMNDSKVMDAMGADGMKKVDEMMSDCLVSSQSNLLRVAPKMSDPEESWVKADPAFWNAK